MHHDDLEITDRSDRVRLGITDPERVDISTADRVDEEFIIRSDSKRTLLHWNSIVFLAISTYMKNITIPGVFDGDRELICTQRLVY